MILGALLGVVARFAFAWELAPMLGLLLGFVVASLLPPKGSCRVSSSTDEETSTALPSSDVDRP